MFNLNDIYCDMVLSIYSVIIEDVQDIQNMFKTKLLNLELTLVKCETLKG